MSQYAPLPAEGLNTRSKIFLFGPAGGGKSIELQRYLVQLLNSGESAYSILVLVSELEHADRIAEYVKGSKPGPFSELRPSTFYGLARRMVTLFWPLIARPGGFSRPHCPPSYLSYDLAQLLMGQLVGPMIDQGAFAGIVLRRQAIISQILDTMNRAALNRLSIEEAFERQLSAWVGSDGRRRVLQDAAAATRLFRQRCKDNNLLDLSLTIELFDQQLLGRHLNVRSQFQRYFTERFRHILVDNLEEQPPAGQHFVDLLLKSSDSALLVFDQGGGYKRFLAADPRGAYKLRNQCDQQLLVEGASNTALVHLANLVENRLQYSKHPEEQASSAIRKVITTQFRGQMVNSVSDAIKNLLAEKAVADDVVIVAPYLDSGLSFNLTTQLESNQIPYRFLQRRSVPRNEAKIRSWLTWLVLSHPSWGIPLQQYDLAEALQMSISGLDPVRAQLVAQHMYSASAGELLEVDQVPDSLTERVGARKLVLVRELWHWLKINGSSRFPVDVFLHRLFHDLLSQPQFQPAPDYGGAAGCDWLVRMAKRFHQSAERLGMNSEDVGPLLYDAIYQGLVTGTSLNLSRSRNLTGVVVATIYSYLLVGKQAKYQFWLDIGATGWWDIPRQPLSNAFVLNPDWPAGEKWTMKEDVQVRNQLLSRIIRGLTNRCSGQIILANSELDRRGRRQDGQLWRALQSVVL